MIISDMMPVIKSLITFANSLLSVFKNSLIIRRSGDEFVILTELKHNQIIENLKIVDQRLLEEYQREKFRLDLILIVALNHAIIT